jgi:carboxymethylenebutenolidase
MTSRLACGSIVMSSLIIVIAAAGTSVRSESRAASKAATTQPRIAIQRVTFKSGDRALFGALYKPQGAGPFPALIWNHGSEKAPGAGPQFGSVASIFVPAGYVVFAPVRRGHGYSKGRYIVDAIQQTRAAEGAEAANRMAVHLLETEQLDDQLAGLAYAKQQAFVDRDRIAVAGCSYGGIQTLLGAERNVGYKAAISLSPAALSWNNNPLLQKRLLQSLQGINIPVLLLQPAATPAWNRAACLARKPRDWANPLQPKSTPIRDPRMSGATALAAPKACMSGRTTRKRSWPPTCTK